VRATEPVGAMKTADVLTSLSRRVPEFTPDDLFLDLPYVVFGEFAGFVVERIRESGIHDPVVKRSFEFVNGLFVEGDRETVNIIETTLFEQLSDDRVLSEAAEALLEESARQSFQQIARWAGSGT
jgi:hypothetical protein